MLKNPQLFVGEYVGGGAAYSVPFVGSTGLLAQDPTKFKYNGTYFSLHGGGVGTASALLHVLGTTTSHVGKFDVGLDFNQVVAPSTPPTLALLGVAGNINVGTHYYRFTYKTALGETELNTGTGATTTYITTVAGNQQVLVSNIPIPTDYRVTHVCIYRAVTGNVYYVDVKKVGEVAVGVTTFTDNIADSSRTGNDVFAKGNTTNRFVTVNGLQSMMISPADTYLGYRAGEGSIAGTTGGGENTIFGGGSGISTYGSKNVAIGPYVLLGYSDSSVLIGHNAGGIGQNHQGSVGLGRNTMFYCTSGYGNMAIGGYSMFGTTYYTSNYNTAVGGSALQSIATGSGNNVGIGTAAGNNLTTSIGSIILGAFIQAPSTTLNGQLNIGNVLYGVNLYATAVSSSTPQASGRIGIGLTTPTARLHLPSQTTFVSSAPLKFTSGASYMSAIEDGAWEYQNGTNLAFSIGSTRYTFPFLERAQTWSNTQTFTMPTAGTVATIFKAAATPSTDLVQFKKNDGTVFGYFSAEVPSITNVGNFTMYDRGIAIAGGSIATFHTDDQNPCSLTLFNDSASSTVPALSVYTYNSGDTVISNEGNHDMYICTNGIGNFQLTITKAGKIGTHYQTVPTAWLHLTAGTTAANNAPLKYDSGSLMTTKEAGSSEYNGNFYLSNATLRFSQGGVLFDHYADTIVGGAEADIYTDTLAASTFNVNGDKIIASYSGNFVTIGTELTQLKVYFAGTAIWDSTGVAPTTGTTSWRIVVELIRVSSTIVRYSVSLNTTGASGYVYETTGELTALTLSNTNILKITGSSTGVGSGTGDIVGKMAFIKFEPAA